MTGLSPKYLQYAWVLIITVGWHMFVPFLVLKSAVGLTLPESFAFLGLNRVDGRALFLLVAAVCGRLRAILPALHEVVWPVLETLLDCVPLFRIPSQSIFQNVPDHI